MSAVDSVAGSGGRKWLSLVAVSAVIVMIVGIQDVFGNRLSAVVLAAYTVFPVVLVGLKGVGFTGKGTGRSVAVGIAAGLVYGTIRGLFLRFIPASEVILGADLARLAPQLESGIQLGPVLIRGYWMGLCAVLLFPLFIGIETYFRGFAFLNLKKHVHWTGAVAIAAAVQAVARRTPHSLMMESIAGVLMQKFDNIWAPIFFHGFQFFIALFIKMA